MSPHTSTQAFFLRTFRTAAKNLSRSKGRTMLSILGVFLGALLLTAVIHILGSLTQGMEKKAKNLGADIITITPEQLLFSRANDAMQNLTQQHEHVPHPPLESTTQYAPNLHRAATLKPQELEHIVNTFPAVAQGIPYIVKAGQIFNGGLSSTCQLLGVTSDFASSRGYIPLVGRFFSAYEEKNQARICVLGHALATRLFGKAEKALGKHIRFEYSQIKVLGVLPPLGADSAGTNLDEMVFLPLATLMSRFSFQDHVDGFWIQLFNKADFTHIQSSLERLLRSLHGIRANTMSDFTISTAQNVDDMVVNAFELMSLLGFIGACISFSIGSLGIFSVMTLMVHSRKAEIGIRRAVGTPARVILQQFLCEAGLISGLGGLGGSLFGLLFVYALSLTGFIESYYNMTVVIGVMALSLLCGLMAGGYPAFKASRIEIISALRSKQ